MKRLAFLAALLLLLAACTRHGPPLQPAPDAAASRISVTAVEAVANEAVGVTVRLHDAAGEPLARAGVSVAFYTTAGSLASGQLAPASTGPLAMTTDAEGVAAASLTSAPGEARVSAYLGEDDTAAKIGEVSVTFRAGDEGEEDRAEPSAEASALAASSDKASTGESVTLSVTLRDATGKPLALAGRSVTFAAAGGRLSGDGAAFAAEDEAVTVVSDAAGVATAHLLGEADGAVQASAHLGADTDAALIGTVAVAFASVVMDDLAVTYDGEPHSPTAVFSDAAAAEGAVYGYALADTGEELEAAPSDAGAYTVTVVAGGGFPGSATATLTIEPRELPFAGPAVFADKAYDGTSATTVDLALDAAAIVPGDDVGLDAAMAAEFQVFQNEAWVPAGHVGPYTDGVAARASGLLALVGADAANYAIVQPIGAATIAPLPLTLVDLAAAAKQYDGTTEVAVTGTFEPAPVPGEDVSFTAALASPNAGTGVPVVFALAGADAGNYALVDAALTVDVTARPATVTAPNGSKVYGDELALGATAFTVSGLLEGDAIATVALASDGAAATADAAPYSVIPSGAVGAAGTLVSNYQLAYVPGTLTVQPRTLTITPDAGQGKTYGDAEPALDFSQTGLVNGDTVTGAIAREPGEDVGAYAFDLSDLAVVDGNGGANYTLTLGGDVTFGITARPLTITPDAGQTRTYGDLDPTFTYALSGDIVGEASLTGALGRVPGRDVGSYAFTLGDLAVADGNGGANYALSLAGDATFTITHRHVTLGGAFTVTERHYDGTEGAQVAVNDLTLVQGVAGDDVAVAPVARFGDRHVGHGKPVTLTAATSLVGADAGNYLLDLTGAPSAPGTITRAPISFDVSNKDTLTYTGQPLALVVVTDPSPLPAVEPVAYTLTYRRIATPTGEPLDQGVAAIREAGLYRVTITSTDARYVGQDEILVPVYLRPITLTAQTSAKVYGEADPSLAPVIATGSLAAGHALTGELAYSGSDAGAYDLSIGSVKVMRAGQDVSANYALFVTARFTIDPAPVTFDIGNAELLVDGVHLFPSDGATPIGLEILSTPEGMTDYRLSYRRTHDAAHQPIPSVRQPVPTIAAFGTYAVTIESLNPNYAGTSVRTVWVTNGVGLAAPALGEGGEQLPVEAVVRHPITITLPFLGGDGQPRPLGPLAMTFQLNSTPATGLLFRDPVTGQPITSITAPAGAAEVSFEVMVEALSTAPYAVSLGVIGWFDEPVSILEFEVQPQAALVVLGDAPVIGQGALSAPITVQLQDGDGLPVLAPADLTLALAGDGIIFVSATAAEAITSVTVPAGASSAQFRVTATQVGSHPFTIENASGVPGVGDAAPIAVTVNPMPTVDGLDVTTIEIGETRELVVTGAHFAGGATAMFSGAGLTVTAVSVDHAGQMTVTVAAGLAATEGAYDLTITNPDGGTTTVTAAVTLTKPVLSASDDGPFGLVEGGNLVLRVADLLANDASTSATVTWGFDAVTASQNVSVAHNAAAGTLTVTATGAAGTAASFTYRLADQLGTTATATVTFNVSLAPIEAIVFSDADEFNAFVTSGYEPPTFEQVFNTWPRASNNAYFADPNTATGDAAAWRYESGRIVQPNNTWTHEFILSPLDDALEYYDFEATLQSGDSDDDSIGLVIAFVRDNGVNKALVAHRTQGGDAPNQGWGITYFENGAPTVLTNVSVGGVRYSNFGGWGGRSSRVKIERNGDLIRASASTWTSLSDFQGEMVIDLDANTINGTHVAKDLSVFKGKQQYGYYTNSQRDSTYLDAIIEGGVARDLAILLTDGFDSYDDGYLDTWTGSQVWRFSEGWTQVPAWTVQDELGFPREVTSVAPFPSPGGMPVGTRYELREAEVVLVPAQE